MAYNNLQILNFNHNIVSLSNGNTLVITDNIKGNSISIPEPITHILQINSPGPQGPQGPSGSGGGGNINTGSFATTGSNTFRGNQTITGSSTTNINSGAFTVTSPSIPFLYMTSSGYFKIGSPDADYGIDMDLSGVGQMRLINGNQITTWAPIIKFGLDNNPVVVEITGSLDVEGSVNIANGNLGLQYKFVNLTSTGNYVITDNSSAVVYRFSNASSTSYNVEIPPANTCPNRIYWISRSNDGTVIGAVTLQCSSNIEDNAGNFNTSFNIGENQKYQWISNGTQWIMISG